MASGVGSIRRPGLPGGVVCALVAFVLLTAVRANAQDVLPSFRDLPHPASPSIGSMPLVTILFAFDGYPAVQPVGLVRETVRSELFGCDDGFEGDYPSDRCMNGYWRESSYGLFGFHEAETTYWISSMDDRTTAGDEGHYTYWWGPNDDCAGGCPAEDGFTTKFHVLRSWHRVLGTEAFYAFWKQFDADGDDTIRLGREVALLVIENRPNCSGQTSYGSRNLGGLTFEGGISNVASGEIGGCAPFHQPFYIYAHEIGHEVFGPYGGEAVWDTYGAATQPENVLHYHLFGGSMGPLHLPSYNKLRLGWLDPDVDLIVPSRDRWVELPQFQTDPAAVVLHDPARGEHEYFLIENRWQGTSYDYTHLNQTDATLTHDWYGLADEGLVVWHVDELAPRKDSTPGIHTRLQLVPRAIGPGDGHIDWRVVYQDAAWDGDDAGFYALHGGSDPVDLAWWDGGESPVGIWDMSAPGAVMRVYVDVPGPGVVIHREAAPYRAWHVAHSVGGTVGWDVPVTNTGDGAALDVRWTVQGLPEGFVAATQTSTLPGRQTVWQRVEISEVPCQRFEGPVSATLRVRSLADGGVFDEAPVALVVRDEAIPAPVVDVPILVVWPEGDQPDLDDQMIPANPTSVTFTGDLFNAGNVVGLLMALAVDPVALPGSIDALPGAIPPHWLTIGEGFAPGTLGECRSESRPFAFTVSVGPDEFVAAHDVEYRLELVGTSVAGDEARTPVTVKVMATPASRMRHLARFAQQRAQTFVSPDIAGKLEVIRNTVVKAIALHEARKVQALPNVLGAADNQVHALAHAIRAQAGKKLTYPQASELLLATEVMHQSIGAILVEIP